MQITIVLLNIFVEIFCQDSLINWNFKRTAFCFTIFL